MQLKKPTLFTGMGLVLLCANLAFAALPPLDFKLQGSGNLRWFGLKIYTASLWTGPAQDGPQQLLLLEYARSVSRERLYASTLDEWVRLHGDPDPDVAGWLSELQSLYPDVQKGSRLACLVEPGGPTRFYLDDVPIGTIEAPDFGPDFLAIWLDPDTSRPGLRRKLLGLE